MDRLNVFSPFESRKNNHEDVLTRNFLILLKNIPLLQVAFFELVRKNLAEKNVEIESIATGQLTLSAVYTQVDDSSSVLSEISDVQLVSIIISDEEFKTDHVVKSSDRHARYDGLFICEPSIVFTLENKPYHGNIWENQLDPNTADLENVTVIPTPCTLSWRDMIQLINDMLEKNVLTPLERSIINDFIEYVDNNYDWLNPFKSFHLCKSKEYLLNKRCHDIMSAYSTDVTYHKGWRKNYINIGNYYIQQFALDSYVADGTWEINLWMYVGDVMNSAKASYAHVDFEKLLCLGKDSHYSFAPNLHFSTQRQGQVWCTASMSFEEYFSFWKGQYEAGKIRQIQREEFDTYLDYLEKNKQINKNEREEFQSKIASKKYSKVNLCPGFLIKYTWKKEEAIELDKKGEFENSFINVINNTLDVFK